MIKIGLKLWFLVVSTMISRKVKGGAVSFNPIVQKVDIYMPNLSFPLPQKKLKKFKIALITAGSMRSFLYTERSWQKYLVGPWIENIYLFAHVTANHHKCELSNKGIDALREIATELEIGYSSAPLVSIADIKEKLKSNGSSCYVRMVQDSMKSGNILDMYARRSRAYQMAVSYGKKHQLVWDLVVFTRLDSAYYAPAIDFWGIHMALKNYTAVTGNRTIVIPSVCSFGGYCDRFAVGHSEEMGMFFDSNLLYKIHHWAQSPTVDLTSSYNHTEALKLSIRNGNVCGSERSMMVFLQYMNGIIQADTVPPTSSFITLRSLKANKYCESSRIDVNNNRLFHWTEKTTSQFKQFVPVPTGFDLVRNAYERCGNAYKVNATELCITKACHCGLSG